MPSHITDSYKDGFLLVTYCTICGMEAPEIFAITECEGKYNPQEKYLNEMKKNVDKKANNH